MRKKIVAGNWKMNKTKSEASSLVDDVLNALEKNTLDETIEIVFAPPFVYLTDVSEKCQKGQFKVAAQNCSEFDSGAYTGEVSPAMINSTGAEYVIIGHSERREYYNEDDQTLKNKVDRAIENKLKVIFCVGEKLGDRKAKSHFEVVSSQITKGLFHLAPLEFGSIVLAYEPVWAIGTGETATKEQAQEMHEFIRNLIAQNYGDDLANSVSILYGGSCKPSNAKELFDCKDVDGGLIGGASLNADDFVSIIDSL